MKDQSTRQGLGPVGQQANPAQDEVDKELEALRQEAIGPESDEVDSSQALPGWERANMPEGEWKRALAASDAAIEREQPGSAEFARLMEVRIRLHFPRPKRLSWEDIEAFKAAQYRAALAEDLRRELRRGSSDSTAKWVVMTIVVFILAAIIGMLVYAVLFMPRPEPP